MITTSILAAGAEIAGGSHINPIRLFLDADIVVQVVMGGLTLASIWVWTILLSFSLRMRRLRSSQAMRDLLQENEVSLKDLIYPIFVEEGLDDFAPLATHGQVKGLNQISAGFPRGGSGPNGLLLGSDFRNA